MRLPPATKNLSSNLANASGFQRAARTSTQSLAIEEADVNHSITYVPTLDLRFVTRTIKLNPLYYPNTTEAVRIYTAMEKVRQAALNKLNQ